MRSGATIIQPYPTRQEVLIADSYPETTVADSLPEVAAAITSPLLPSLTPAAALSRLALGIKVPVSATLAPLSRLCILLRVLTGLPAILLSPVQGVRSKLVRRIDVRGLKEGRRGEVMLNESAGETARSGSRLPTGRGIATGSVIVSSPGDLTGLPIEGGSPKEDATEGGGTDGYVSSIAARGRVAGPRVRGEPGVVALVALLVPAEGENIEGEGMDAEAEEGGVVDGLSEAGA